MIDQTVLWRALTFLALVIMAITDIKTKTVPSVFPFAPALFGILWIDNSVKLGYSLDFYWYLFIVFSFALSATMWFIKAFAPADSIAIICTSLTMFTYEGVAFLVIVLGAYGLFVYNAQRSKKIRREVPLMPLIAVAYILAVALL